MMDCAIVQIIICHFANWKKLSPLFQASQPSGSGLLSQGRFHRSGASSDGDNDDNGDDDFHDDDNDADVDDKNLLSYLGSESSLE